MNHSFYICVHATLIVAKYYNANMEYICHDLVEFLHVKRDLHKIVFRVTEIYRLVTEQEGFLGFPFL